MSVTAAGPATAMAPMPSVVGTNETAGARRINRAFARAAGEGRAALVPYVVAGYPDAETSFRVALAAADAGADLLEVGLPYSDPLADGATLQRASQVALAAGATFDGSIALIERIAAARPELPVVPMAYANQVIGGGDGVETARRLAAAGASGVIVADLTPDEGGSVRGCRPDGRPRRGLPRRADDRAGPSGEDRGPDGRLPVLRLARRRHRRPVDAAPDCRPAGQGGPRGESGAGGGRLWGQPSGPRSRTRRCRGRRCDRRVGARRCAGRGRPRRRRARPSRGRAPGRHAPRLTCRRSWLAVVRLGARDPGAILAPDAPDRIDTGEEIGQKRTFRWAIDWPGWARAGKTPDLALEALVAAAPRFAIVAHEAGFAFPAVPSAITARDIYLVESVPGGSGTDFGVPSAVTPADRRPVDVAEAARLAAIVGAAWTVFDRVAAAAPAELRKGPRGGGRDTARMVGHVVEADHAYAREIGVRLPAPPAADRHRGRGRAGRDAGGPAPAVRRLTAGRPAVDRPLCGPADRLARPRPRLGDRGPDRTRLGPQARLARSRSSRATSAAMSRR